MLKAALCALLLASAPASADPQSLKLLVLGDSISQGFNAVKFGLAPEYNWATGDKINSYKARLEATGYQVQSKNVSIPIAPSHWLGLELYLARGFTPDLVLIEIGANDLCHAVAKPDTIGNVAWTIDRLLEQNPKVQIVLAGVPRISAVYESKKSSQACLDRWKIPLCPAFLSPDLTDKERAINQFKIDSVNAGLRQLASVYPGTVRYVTEIGETPIMAEDISDVDCFHPSPTGQGRLAEAAFLQSWQ
jgi:lysophospholipase L1-like esterase